MKLITFKNPKKIRDYKAVITTNLKSVEQQIAVKKMNYFKLTNQNSQSSIFEIIYNKNINKIELHFNSLYLRLQKNDEILDLIENMFKNSLSFLKKNEGYKNKNVTYNIDFIKEQEQDYVITTI